MKTKTTTLACRVCGVATDDRRATEVQHTTLTGQPRTPYLVGLCDGCHDAGIAPDEFGSAVRAALHLLGRPVADWRLAADAFMEAGIDVTPILAERATPQRPWAHVPKEVREALKAAYLPVLDRKVFAAAKTEERPIPAAPPPDDAEYPGCLMCGLDKQVAPWRGPVHTKAFTKPRMTTGFLCSQCAESAEAVGAIGATALERAAMLYHGLDWTENVRIPHLRAAVAEGIVPSGTPWSWVEFAEPEDPGLDPIALLRKEVADLTARVADLEARLS